MILFNYKSLGDRNTRVSRCSGLHYLICPKQNKMDYFDWKPAQNVSQTVVPITLWYKSSWSTLEDPVRSLGRYVFINVRTTFRVDFCRGSRGIDTTVFQPLLATPVENISHSSGNILTNLICDVSNSVFFSRWVCIMSETLAQHVGLGIGSRWVYEWSGLYTGVCAVSTIIKRWAYHLRVLKYRSLWSQR